MLQPTYDSAVQAIRRVREHSRSCCDLKAREYLIRVERHMIMLLVDVAHQDVSGMQH
ncbi:hypothetical protein [Azospirillum picis]|uniref:Uncharacterized protein n=1 Tax=Azospirillum picis TaxID=488438 RepID=A0ABU0MDV2_9PROT|nr:hypothetical protein [Azospirillum picis]MBP2297375.1 hypothetical protein [Azospirillum picis]MDQ0531602.1 hypothetical protein [Azospirillum picis]